MSLINCEIEYDLPWSKECILSEISITFKIPANPNTNPPVQEVAAMQTTEAVSQINNAKLYAPFDPLSH